MYINDLARIRDRSALMICGKAVLLKDVSHARPNCPNLRVVQIGGDVDWRSKFDFGQNLKCHKRKQGEHGHFWWRGTAGVSRRVALGRQAPRLLLLLRWLQRLTRAAALPPSFALGTFLFGVWLHRGETFLFGVWLHRFPSRARPRLDVLPTQRCITASHGSIPFGLRRRHERKHLGYSRPTCNCQAH